jgi:hypothetical protein
MDKVCYSYPIKIIPYKNPNNGTRIIKTGLVDDHGIQPSLQRHNPGNDA